MSPSRLFLLPLVSATLTMCSRCSDFAFLLKVSQRIRHETRCLDNKSGSDVTNYSLQFPFGRKIGDRRGVRALRSIPIRRENNVNKNDGEKLVPEENPTADPNVVSLSNVRYSEVLRGLNKLYPPQDLEKRNSVSRSDGYWPFINSGTDPPKEFTYGEFDFYFFAQLLDRAHYHYYKEDEERPIGWEGKVFADIGSGTGRLVLGAAALHPGWKLCRGIEVLKGIHEIAVGNLQECHKLREEAATESPSYTQAFFGENDQDLAWLCQLQQKFDKKTSTPSLDETEENEGSRDSFDGVALAHESDSNEGSDVSDERDGKRDYFLQVPAYGNASSPSELDSQLHLSPIELSCGSFEDPYEYFGDIDCAFVFSSCMSEHMMKSLSHAIGRQCKPGTVVITTEFPLHLKGFIGPVEDDTSMPSGSYEIEILERIDGWCWLVGGKSTAYIHRVVNSLWEEGVGRRKRPIIPLEEQAWRIVMAMERGELSDTNKFLRDVYNDMAFYGFPEEWRPKLEDDTS